MIDEKSVESPLLTLKYPNPSIFQTIHPPSLHKIITSPTNQSLFCGYSDGKIHHYDTRNHVLTNIFSPYDNTDVIDLEPLGTQGLVTCTHNEVTVFDIVKSKSFSLKGHEETPIAVAVHPISPIVTSISNLVLQHDLRIRKPINVNFITPPVYNVQYFSDGTFYFLSGEPCRIGREVWVRTLVNGMGKASENCKFVAINDMSGNLILWDWRRSVQRVKIPNVENTEVYQSVYFAKKEGNTRGLIFLEDNGFLLQHDLLENKTERRMILPEASMEHWKLHVNSDHDTSIIYVYQHEQALIKVFSAHSY